MKFELLTSKKNKPMLRDSDGYIYWKIVARANRTYWRCIHYRAGCDGTNNTKCDGRAVTFDGKFELTTPHDHFEEENHAKKQALFSKDPFPQFRFTILNDEVEDYSNNNCPNDQCTELNTHNTGPLNLTNNNSNSKFSTTPTTIVVADYEDEDSSSNGQTFLVAKTSTRGKERARDNNSDGGDKNNSSGNQSETDNDTFEREKSLSANLNDRGESESSNRSGSQNSPSQNSPSESDQAMQFVLTKITSMIETADNAFKGHYEKLAKLTACLQGELVSLKNSELQTRKLHKIEKQRSDLYFRKYSHLKREAHNLRKRARQTTGSKKEG
uniref:FLYWCH-type domain-containing protein n=1 Tax=Ditylenchus dipsaci TaxID=166011 RepID=A0A915DTH6_9BILA